MVKRDRIRAHKRLPKKHEKRQQREWKQVIKTPRVLSSKQDLIVTEGEKYDIYVPAQRFCCLVKPTKTLTVLLNSVC